MDRPGVQMLGFDQRCVPGRFDDLLIVKFFENSITSQNNEVVVVTDLEAFYVRGRYYHFGIASVLWLFCLNVAYGTRHRKSAREYSMRTNYQVHCSLALWCDIRNIIAILIYSSTVFFDSLSFISCLRLVVTRK